MLPNNSTLTFSNSPSGQKNSSIEISPLPYIPDQIDLSHLKPNGKLLTDEEIQRISPKHPDPTDTRYRKSELGSEFGIIQLQNQYFGVYKGETQEEALHQDFILGKGGFGKIKILQELKSGKWYALKIQPISIFTHVEEKEYQSLLAFKKAVGRLKRYSPSKHRRQHEIIMELAPGIDLFSFGYEKKHMKKHPVTKLMAIIIAVMKTVQELHNQNYIHADIKLENIMCDAPSEIATLIDLAFTMTREEAKKNDTELGSPTYIAPECHGNPNNYTEKSDIYALGKCIAAYFHLMRVTDTKGGFSVTDESWPEFKQANKIPDIEVRRQVLNLLHEMTNKDPAIRQPIAYYIEEFEKIQRKLLADANLSTGLLDVDEFFNATEEQQKDLLKALKSADEVWLIDTNRKYSALKYIELKRTLNKHHINIGNKIFSDSIRETQDLIASIPQHIQSIDPNKVARTYCYITTRSVENTFLRKNNVYAIQAKNCKDILSDVSSQKNSPRRNQALNPLLKIEKNQVDTGKRKASSEHKHSLAKTAELFNTNKIPRPEDAFNSPTRKKLEKDPAGFFKNHSYKKKPAETKRSNCHLTPWRSY